MPRRRNPPAEVTPSDTPPPSPRPQARSTPKATAKPKRKKPGSVAQRIALLERQERKRNQLGRTPAYSPLVAEGICADIAAGVTFRQACQSRGLDHTGVWRWRTLYPEFGNAYARAREAEMDYRANEIVEIADDGSNDWMERETRNGKITVLNDEHVRRSQLRIDTRKFLMAKLAPRVYGDKLALTDGAGDPLFRIRQLTDEQRLAEALVLVERVQETLRIAREQGMTIEGEGEEIEEEGA